MQHLCCFCKFRSAPAFVDSATCFCQSVPMLLTSLCPCKECFLVPSRFSNSCTSELPSQLQLTWGASLETRAADCNDCVGIFFGEIKVADFQEFSLSYVAAISPHGWDVWLEHIYLTHTLQGDKGAHVHYWIIWVTWPNVEAAGKDIGNLFGVNLALYKD